MPVYQKENLLDFSSKIPVKKSFRFTVLRYPKINLPDTLFIIACACAVAVLLFAIYSVWG